MLLVGFDWLVCSRPQAVPDDPQLPKTSKEKRKTLDIQNGSKNLINNSTFFGTTKHLISAILMKALQTDQRMDGPTDKPSYRDVDASKK